jgi:hypothetical protein
LFSDGNFEQEAPPQPSNLAYKPFNSGVLKENVTSNDSMATCFVGTASGISQNPNNQTESGLNVKIQENSLHSSNNPYSYVKTSYH